MSRNFNWHYKTASVFGESHVRSESREAFCTRTGASNVEDQSIKTMTHSEIVYREKVAA